MKNNVLVVSLMMWSVSSISSAAEPVRIATEGAYPPFNNVTASGELVGFDVDIANALCEKMQRECEIVAQDWDGIIPALTNNKYDAIVASMSITDERSKVIDFTNPYYSNYLAVVGKTDKNIDFEKLKDVSVGTQRSTAASAWVEDTLGRRGDVKLYDSNPAAMSDLVSGRVDAVVSDYLPASDWLKSNSDYSYIKEKIDIDDQIGIGVRKGEEDLLNAFNKALDEIRADGTYVEISEKHFGVDIF